MAVSSGTDTLHIRKYPNRRYYDTTRSRHVRLQDIRRAVQNGHTVCVRDSKTDDDITNQVLGQIVLTDEEEKLKILSPMALHALIRYGMPAWRETVEKLTELFHVIDRQEWRLGHATTAGRDQESRSKSMPSKDVLISHLQQHVDMLTSRIGELRRGRTV